MQTDLEQIPLQKHISKKGSYHLSGDQINFILAELGQFKRPSHIISDFQNTYNRTLDSSSLTYFQKRYANDIKQVRDQWVNALADEAGSHKRVRVVKLYEMYCSLENDLSNLNKSEYAKTITTKNGDTWQDDDVKSYESVKLRHHKQMESLLGSLRVEMEGNTININYRNLSTQKDDDLIDTARDVLNKVDPSLIEDANYKILVDDGKDNK